jgi:hypothetical protein
MSDYTKVNYYNGWDIDQLIAQGTVNIGSGDSAIYTISNSSLPNVFEVLFQPTGSTYWYQAGTSSTNGTIAGLFTFYTYINGTNLYIHTTTTGIARYYIWSDKVNY